MFRPPEYLFKRRCNVLPFSNFFKSDPPIALEYLPLPSNNFFTVSNFELFIYVQRNAYPSTVWSKTTVKVKHLV